MTGFLLQLGTMSLKAAIIVIVVLMLRFLFSKLHIAKKYTNLLWIIPYIAMILPWGIKTPFSFWNITYEGQTKVEQVVNTLPYRTDSFLQMASPTLPENMEDRWAPPTIDQIIASESDSGSIIENTISNETNIVEANSSPLVLSDWDIVVALMFIVWIIGMLAFLLHGVVSSLKLKKKLVCSLVLRENVYVADDIKEPFVFGVFSPKIYLPCNLTVENEYYVVEHEKTHIKRKDPIKKVIAFIITGIHWFNPIVWVAFHMMTKDMEMACDEETVQRIGTEKRQDYAQALLKLSAKKRNLLIPVAFGEGNVKSRIKNILHYKKTLKILAVLAGVLIVVIAAVFLTKPTEQTTTLSNLRADDGPMVMPSEDSPREITVTYEGENFTFSTEFYDTFRVFLEDLEVRKEELNKSRSEDRPAEIVIWVHGGAAYNFDEDMSTIWCDNGVKPSMSYEVTEPKRAISFIERQIASYEESIKDGKSNVNEEISTPIDTLEYDASYVDLVPQLTPEEVKKNDICGENGPFLDYADDKYIVFHTTEWFYVYDMTIGDMVWSVGHTNIFKVEVDTTNLKAYVHDVVDGDMIFLYECDIENQNYILAEDMPTLSEEKGLLNTNECVPVDHTVYRTENCAKLEDGRYLYLESGSGLLKDLCLRIEDAEGNITSCNMFVYTMGSFGKQDKALQMLTEESYVEMMDITHDGELEYIIVDFGEIKDDTQKSVYIKVADKEGNIIWQKEMFLAAAGWDSYYLVKTEKGECLMQYLPIVHQDKGNYSYRVFYLNEDGSEVEVANESVGFTPYPLNEAVSAKEAIPMEEMVSFANNVNTYFENARLLVSTVDGGLRYQTPGRTYTYKELYQTSIHVVGLQFSESIELNITKLQNYYEKARKSILDKQGVILIED